MAETRIVSTICMVISSRIRPDLEWAPFLQSLVYFSSLFSVLMLNYFKQVIRNYKKAKYHSLTIYIELGSKSVRVAFNLALLKDN